ncbi:MAG: EamA family transporter [Betaproteobacteria bacterium]|nr:EamA family transporter [Betaproteobacteria bacterium]
MSGKLLAALAVAFSGQVLYHFCQKAVAPGLNPIAALVGFYVVAALGSLPLLAMFPLQGGVMQQVGGMNWAVAGVGLSIVLIEVGFLLAYRAGGELSTAFVLTSASVACTLLLLGVLVHGEAITLHKLAGIAFALVGIVLVSRG